MKKSAALIAVLLTLTFSTPAFASLADTRASIAQQYGEYRLVIDTDNQLWTSAEWEATGMKKAKASSLMYVFDRQGLRIQMEVQYDGAGPDATVRAQRFTPDAAIRIRDFAAYFPEIAALATAPQAEAFATYNQITLNFQEEQSPVTMGVVVKAPAAPSKRSYYTLLAFNVQDEGRLLKNPQYIGPDTYIREFTVERVTKSTVSENLNGYGGEWTPVKNYFKNK